MTRIFKSTWGISFPKLPLGFEMGVEAKRGELFFGVRGSKKEFCSWDLHLEFKLSKGLKRESKVSVEEGNIPELKFGSPHLKHSHETFFRALYTFEFIPMQPV